MRRLAVLFIISTFSFMFFSCSENNDCDCDIPELREISAVEESIIESSNDFSFNIFSRINQTAPDKNLFISPLSISTALSMTANGAAGETKSGIKSTLHQGDLTDEEINTAYRDLAEFLTNLDPKVIMKLANSNWYKDDYQIKEQFKTILMEYYDAEVKATDFSNPETYKTVNEWIESKTEGKIEDMLGPLPSNTVMLLINAIYLKAMWQYEFDKEMTEQRDFHLKSGNTVKTDIMFSDGVKVNLYTDGEVTFVEIPYGNGQFTFTILMPEIPSQLDELISKLNAVRFNEYLENADTTTAELYLPKFKVEYDLSLKPVLSEMGMASSFVKGDFSNLFDETLDLKIDDVLHKAFIELDEEGTEAAAATVVIIVETSAGGGGSKPVVKIDKPFAFCIREKHTNTILFAGKLLDPTKAN